MRKDRLKILDEIATLLGKFPLTERHQALVTLMALHVAGAPPDKVEPVLRAMSDQALVMLQAVNEREKDAPLDLRH